MATLPPEAKKPSTRIVYKTCNEKEFKELGAAIMKRSPEGRSELLFKRRWNAHFGVDVPVVVDAWARLKILAGDPDKPEHLLWALMFLKLYGSEEEMAGLCGPEKAIDEQTYRKWTKIFIQRLECLWDEVVGFVCVFACRDYYFYFSK